MWLLDRLEEKDKEYYDKIFNEYKTAFRKAYGKNLTDEEVRMSLEYSLYFISEETLLSKETKEDLLSKLKEKQYRPCTLDNFGLHIGDLIKFRRKDIHNYEICTMYMGYLKTNSIVKVILGGYYYSFEELFNEYEWFDKDSNTWEPFGVEE